MKHIGLFEGIGGFSLAARMIGWETIAWCEWNEFGQKVLSYHFPKANAHGDITKTDFTIYRGKCDILTGGFPCQPYSMAGKRKGKEDDRHLWPEMLRAIREIQPRWIVGENVFGLINWSRGLVFHEVQSEMEAEGYTVFPYVLPACSINAPHRRDRVWFVAYSNRSGNNSTERTQDSVWQQQDKEQSGDRGAMQINGFSNEQSVTDTDNGCRPLNAIQARGAEPEELHGASRILSNTISTGLEGRGGQWEGLESGYKSTTPSTNSRRQSSEEHWQKESGWVAETGFSNHWLNFPTEPPICGGDDGLPDKLDGITFPKWRNESIKAYGNAIVPQVAYQIFKAIALMEVEINNVQPKNDMQCGVGKNNI